MSAAFGVGPSSPLQQLRKHGCILKRSITRRSPVAAACQAPSLQFD
jgi:hypothetical protein